VGGARLPGAPRPAPFAPGVPGAMAPADAPTLTRRRSSAASMTIDDQVRHAYFTPSPQAYTPYNPVSPPVASGPANPKPLGKISDAKVPSALDHAPNAVAHVPGPGAYEPSDLPYALPEGGRLNRNPPPDRLKIDEYPVPAPCDYGVPNDAQTRPRQLYGRMSKDPKVTKFIDDEVKRGRHIPGPGAHDVQESGKQFLPEGGRYLSADKPPGYFDTAAGLAEGKPGPGAYELPETIQRKEVGRLTYRYESATMQETKDLITKVVGERNSAPGPGTYTLPEPQPSVGAPSLKGRNLAHGMPHPFAYGCAPDLARNFTSVRQQNNAEQIFGTGVRRGAATGAKGSTSRSSRPSSGGRGGDHVADDDLPMNMRPSSDDLLEAGVQWRSGGFSIKKARSTGAMRTLAPEHPTLQEAQKFYPALSRKHKRGSSVFLPMSSKRYGSVSSNPNSAEYEKLCRGKWQLKAVAQGIQNATTAALEPLDTEKLKQEALLSLRDKAKERMSLEGVSKAQQELVLREMDAVYEEQTTKKQAALANQAEAPGLTRDVTLGPEEARLMA